MQYWLKGGIIGVILVFLSYLITLFYTLITNLLKSSICKTTYIATELGNTYSCNVSETFIILIIYIIIIFIIGSILGLVYSKFIKNKK